MEIAFHFNMPPGENKLTVMFGEVNQATDLERKFRVGTIRQGEDPRAVHWSLLDWVDGNDEPRLRQLELEADRGDVVRVERMEANGLTTFFEVDTEANWPAGASGIDPVLSSWSFED